MWQRSISRLSLDCCDIQNDALSKIRVLRNLRFLDLSNNPRLTVDCIKHLMHSRILDTLQLNNCNVSKEFLMGLVNLPSLRVLRIQNHNVSNVDLRAFQNLMPNTIVETRNYF